MGLPLLAVRTTRKLAAESSRLCAISAAGVFPHMCGWLDCAHDHESAQGAVKSDCCLVRPRDGLEQELCRSRAGCDAICQFVRAYFRSTPYGRQDVGRYFLSKVLDEQVQTMLPAKVIGDSARYLFVPLIRVLALGP